MFASDTLITAEVVTAGAHLILDKLLEFLLIGVNELFLHRAVYQEILEVLPTQIKSAVNFIQVGVGRQASHSRTASLDSNL